MFNWIKNKMRVKKYYNELSYSDIYDLKMKLIKYKIEESYPNCDNISYTFNLYSPIWKCEIFFDDHTSKHILIDSDTLGFKETKEDK